jgi:hypothetical protein
MNVYIVILACVSIGIFLFFMLYKPAKTYEDKYYLPKVLEKENYIEPVDIVITWVDSSDVNWQKAKQHFYVDKNSDNESIRFPDVKYPDYELETAILLILKNIQWRGMIYIVASDGQIPKCYEKLKNLDDRIQMVYHSQIWPEQMLHTLPTFNSHAIECNIHRIENLSNNFIYFNDDMYVVKNLEYNSMFYKNSMVLQPLDNRATYSWLPGMWHKVWSKMNKMYDMYSPKHYCLALNRNAMYKAEQSIHNHWKQTISTRFRSKDDVAPVGYTLNYALKNGMGYLTRNPLKLIHYYKKKGIFKYPKNTNVDIICINETRDIHKSISSLRQNCL